MKLVRLRNRREKFLNNINKHKKKKVTEISYISSLLVAWFLDRVPGVCSLFIHAVQNTVFPIDYNRIVNRFHTYTNIYSVKHTLFPEVHSVLGLVSVSSCVRCWTENLQ
jgi:hypothetical protein